MPSTSSSIRDKTLVELNNSGALSLLGEKGAEKHVLVLYDSTSSFNELAASFIESELRSGKTVMIWPSTKESGESIMSLLQNRGIEVESNVKRKALIVMEGPSNNKSNKIGDGASAIANSIQRLIEGDKIDICIIIDYSGLEYDTYDDNLFPITTKNAIEDLFRKNKETRSTMLCCFKELDFYRDYSFMMKEHMVNRHDEVIELNCRHFSRFK